ncbi:TrkH family potassium uptake protein [Candidatus Dependentiae bacterium]
MSNKISKISPGRILLGSFIFVIIVGTILLSLPQARVVDIPLIDLLFTSVSATCVTGLHVLPMSYFTIFGQCVIMALIQIGGLGLMTLSFFLISLIMNLKLITQLVAGQLLEFELRTKIKTFLSLIIGMTFISELIGTIILYFPLREFFDAKNAIFQAMFHSISAFCNSGTALLSTSLIQYGNKPMILLPITSLIFLGGIGFIVWYEIGTRIFKYFKKETEETPKKATFSLHTKVVLTTSLLLIIVGTIFFFFLEQKNTLKDFNLINKIINSLFMSTTTRTAGFNTINMAQTSLPTLFIFIILMFIGASPNSTGSGIKTTTFTIFLATIYSIVLKNKNYVEIYGRRIPIDQIYKTTIVIALGLSWITMVTLILLLTDPNFSFLQIFFESVSSFSTTGLSTGITPYLSKLGKITLIVSMIIGRIGSLTLVLALTTQKTKQLYSYPEERVIIG